MVDEPLEPNLLIPGVTKAGTSSLYWYLTQHPEICSPAGRKEIDHFTPMRWGRPPSGSRADYAAHFRGCRQRAYRLDASPRYFDGGPALVRAVREQARDPKIIVLLRDPVARIWSNYRTLKETGKMPAETSFRQFFERGVEVFELGDGDYQRFTDHRTVTSGRYDDFLRHWTDEFGDDVLVVFFEHLVQDPRVLVASVCAWLGLDTTPVADFDYAARNKTVDPRSVSLSRIAYSINRRVDPTLRRIPLAKDAAHAVYSFVNGRRRRETLSDADRRRAVDFYLPANRALHSTLSDLGYSDLPTWLTAAVEAR